MQCSKEGCSGVVFSSSPKLHVWHGRSEYEYLANLLLSLAIGTTNVSERGARTLLSAMFVKMRSKSESGPPQPRTCATEKRVNETMYYFTMHSLFVSGDIHKFQQSVLKPSIDRLWRDEQRLLFQAAREIGHMILQFDCGHNSVVAAANSTGVGLDIQTGARA